MPSRWWIAGLSVFAAAQFFAASAPATGYDGLDRLGRVAELGYVGPASGGGTATLHAYEYGYDLADQPIWKEVTQAVYAGQSHANQRSWLYGYDNLHRLASADMGALSGHTGSTPNATEHAPAGLRTSP